MDLKINKKQLLALIFILVLASFFRLWNIGSTPGGLFPDEAANGEDALLILQGQHAPFFERGLGREAFYHYLLAISLKLFGIGVWQIHIVSAFIGILTVLATWALAKKMFNTRIAFLTGLFLASSYWHTTLSRTGFRAILVPLLSTLFFYFTYLVFKENQIKKRFFFAALSGIFLGLGFYTYISFRVMIGIIGSLGIIFFITKRGALKKFKKEIIIGIAFCFLILLPLISYFINNPWFFIGRSGYVSIFNPDLNKGNLIGTFLQVLGKTFLMFFVNGDLNWRHNVSGFGMLNIFISPLLLLGFIYCFKKIFKQKFSNISVKYVFLILWFLIMLIPQLLTAEAIPHGLRTIGVIPVVFFFPAIIIDFFLRKSNSKNAILVLLCVILGMGIIFDYALYFFISANAPGFYYAYRSDLTTVSDYLNKRSQKQKTYLVLDEYSVQTPDFLTTNTKQPYQLVNPELSYQTKLNPGEQIVFTQSTIFDTKKFAEYNPNARIMEQKFNQFNQEIMRVYGL